MSGPVSAPVLRVGERALVWDVPAGWVALSSAAVGGGLVRPRWVVNLDVGGGFARTDLADFVAEVAGGLGLSGAGCALLTAADVAQVEHAEHEGARAWSTVGVTRPTWAVAPDLAPARPAAGTINIVVAVPVPLSPSALVQAVGTVVEARAQALVQAGVPGTGTASDAVVVLCPEADGAAEPFAGVRSAWGKRIARAVHTTVVAGLAAHPWPGPDVDPGVVW